MTQLGGLTPEQWQRILAGEAMSVGDAYYTPERTGGNVSMDNYDPGQLTGRVMRSPVGSNQYQMLSSAGDVEQTLDGARSRGFLGDLFSHAGSIAKDTAPIWLAALGANYLAPGLAGGEAAAGSGLFGGGGSALGQAGMTTTLGTPLAELTAGGLLTGTGAPALLSEAAIAAGLTPGLTAAGAAAAAGGAAGGAAAGGAGAAGAAGAGSTLGGLSGRAIGGLLGAAAGAANSGDKTQTTQQKLDPRMEALLYGQDGKGGYLGAATDWFNQNKGGNPLMLQGAQMMADFYRSPAYAAGYNNLRSTGLGLLNTPMAGNPFMRG